MPQSTIGPTERFACAATTWTGSNAAFVLAILVTFVMVFLIQRTQNKESLAMQSKINEIVAALSGASNRMISVEDLSEAELQKLHDRYLAMAAECKSTGATSIDAGTLRVAS